jgi:prepilin-type N-terminal cleavage/methylation domain-containing protein
MRRGYSLIEFAVALAVAGTLATAALGAFSLLNRSVFSMRARSIAETKLQRTLSSLVSDAQEVGGGAIRPWHAVFVRPGDPASDDADTLLLLTVPPGAGVCELAFKAGPFGHARTSGGSASCCLTTLFPSGQPTGLAVVAREVDGEPAVVGRIGAAECKVGITALFDDENGGSLSSSNSEDDARWAGATLSPATGKLVFLDRQTKRLHAWVLTSTADGACAVPAVLASDTHAARLGGLRTEGLCIDERVLAEDVEDLQVALGYDGNADGQLVETATGSTVAGVTEEEEWLGNAASELPAGIFSGMRPAVGPGWRREALRGVAFGVVVGLPVQDGRDRPAVGVLDGPRRKVPGRYLVAGVARGLFRNTGVFQ